MFKNRQNIFGIGNTSVNTQHQSQSYRNPARSHTCNLKTIRHYALHIAVKACVQQNTSFMLSVTLVRSICSCKCLSAVFFSKSLHEVSTSLFVPEPHYLLQANTCRDLGMAPFFADYFCSCQNLQVSSGSLPTIKARKGLRGKKITFK